MYPGDVIVVVALTTLWSIFFLFQEKTLGFAQIQRKDRKFKALPKIPKLKPDSESKENHKPQNHVRGKNQSGPHNNAKNHNSQHYNKLVVNNVDLFVACFCNAIV